jgi:hypothetical protein
MVSMYLKQKLVPKLKRGVSIRGKSENLRLLQTRNNLTKELTGHNIHSQALLNQYTFQHNGYLQ